MELRLATMDDMETLITFRKQLLIDEGAIPNEMDKELIEYFTSVFEDNSLYQLLMIEDNKPIATGGFLAMKFPPGFKNHSGMKAYICNMYTVDAYRGKGIATTILDALFEETNKRGIANSFLNASIQGKPLYLKKGFIDHHAWLDHHS